MTACPPSVAYRLQKFARRHKVLITTASLVAAALILGLIGTASQAVRANAERDAAEIERGHAVAAEREATTLRVQAEAATEVAVTEREIAQKLLTSSQVDRAQVLCESGEIGRGMLWYAHALRTAPEDARDLERVIRTNLAAWQSELHSLRMLVQQDGKVKRVALSPDGSRIVSASYSELCVWDAATGELIGGPVPHDGLQALAFSPEGTHFVTGNADGTAQLWDSATVRPIGSPLEHEGQVDAIAFSTNGSQGSLRRKPIELRPGIMRETDRTCDRAVADAMRRLSVHSHLL